MTLSSVITVIPTFFNNSGTIDYDSIITHINNQINNNIKDIVILGTTSEAPTLNIDERINLAKKIFTTFGKYINIIVGLGGNNGSTFTAGILANKKKQ